MHQLLLLDQDGCKDPCKYPGPFYCDGCGYCQYMYTTRNPTLPDGTKFKAKHHVNCRTKCVLYMRICDCNCFYTGKTIQEFWQRAYRHILSIKTANSELPLGRQVTSLHGGIFPKRLQSELRWILKLKSTTFPGLNYHVSYKPFLDGFVSEGWGK